MNRRSFLEKAGKSILAGLFGMFVLDNETTELIEQPIKQPEKVQGKGCEEFVTQTYNKVLPDKLEWQLLDETKCLDCEGYNCKCVITEPMYVESLSPDYKLADYFKEMNDWWIKNIALGMGVSQEDLS